MKTILHADDDPTVRALVRHTLEGRQHRVVQADDGFEAIRLAVSEQPDLIILDWNMPHLSGLTLAQALRDHAETRHVPIIMLTVRKKPEEIELAESSQVRAYLVKPFRPEDLIGHVDRLLQTAV